MLRIKIKTNYPKLARELSVLAKKQIPYATARTLTALAKAAQAQVVKDLPKHFTIRNQYVPRGITIKPAEKRDWPNCKAIVASRSWFMRLQEEGGVKHPTQLPFVTVPTRKYARPVEQEVIRAGIRPKRLLQLTHSNVNYRIEKLRSTGAQAIVYRPKMRKYKVRAKPGSALAVKRRAQRVEALKKVRVLWVLPHTTHVKKRWNFLETVKRSVRENYGKEFWK